MYEEVEQMEDEGKKEERELVREKFDHNTKIKKALQRLQVSLALSRIAPARLPRAFRLTCAHGVHACICDNRPGGTLGEGTGVWGPRWAT